MKVEADDDDSDKRLKLINKENRVSRRVGVFWEEDKCFYEALILRQNQKPLFEVEYVDGGMKEWLDLSEETLDWSPSERMEKDGVLRKRVIGSQVGVWWPLDRKFYYGTLVDFSKSADFNLSFLLTFLLLTDFLFLLLSDQSSRKHKIVYSDDGKIEWIDLTLEKLVSHFSCYFCLSFANFSSFYN